MNLTQWSNVAKRKQAVKSDGHATKFGGKYLQRRQTPQRYAALSTLESGERLLH
jgi:hypothetical protein